MKCIKLMADYQCHPVWDMSEDEYGDMDPASLPVSKELQERLANWARTYDATLDMDCPSNSGFKSGEEESEFRREGEVLASLLKYELGPEYVVLVEIY